MNGFIKIHRKIKRWGWYSDPAVFNLFLHLIIEANWTDKVSLGVPVAKGQVITGRKKLAKQTGLSEQQVRTALIKLAQTGEISTNVKANKYTIITIRNYRQYQVDDRVEQPTEQPTTNQQPTNSQPLSKKDKKVKNTTFDPFSMRPEWFQEEDWIALVEHRRSHKAKLSESERAYKVLIKQFEEAKNKGFSPTECVDEMVSRGWQSFKAEYMQNNKPRPFQNKNQDNGWI
jgi:hypothetical protein